MFHLRPYQQELINNTRRELLASRSVITQAPTGAGKSKIFIAIAKMAATSGTTTLILSESTKIFRQIASEYPAVLINPSSSVLYIAKGATYIAMAQTLARRVGLIKQFADMGRRLLVINDEAHIGTPTKLLKQLPDAYLIGFTATPAWKWAKHLPDLYKAIVTGPQVSELVEAGYLSQYQHFARVAANISALKLKAGEFTEESQEIAFESPKVYDALRDDLSSHPFKKCLVFTASIHQCKALHAALAARGINAIQVHSEQSDAVNGFGMKDFESLTSKTNVCVSVGTLTKGFDFPTIDLIVLMRATTSLPLYLQMIGRGSRTVFGKSIFTVLDYGQNYSRFGLWNDDRDWVRLSQPSKLRTRDSVASVKMCPQCEYIAPTAKMICPNCGHSFEPTAKERAEETQLVDVTNLIRGKNIGDLDAMALALAAKSNTVKKSFAIRVAKAREQAKPGYLEEFAKHMGYKKGWVQYQEVGQEPIEFFNKRL